MVKKILLGLITVIALLLIFAATRPDSFRVERNMTIQAPAPKVFALLQDFHHFPQWSPWQHLDPTMQTTFSGAPRGPGAVYAWEGNDQVGAGRMEILGVVPDREVRVKLDFFKPFASQNTTVYTLQSQGNTLTVTWAMHGPSPYISKLLGIFVSMDRMIGKDFESGLLKLKTLAEKNY